MSVNSYTYGTMKGVHRRIGWVCPNRQMFDGETTPTAEDVELTLDQTASELHMRLARAGYPVSTAATLATDSPRAAAWMAALNEDGASAFILGTMPQAFDPEQAGVNPYKVCQKRWEDGLKMVDSQALDELDLYKSETESDQLYSGSGQDEDGYEKLPFFKRGQFDFPGSRSLTENDAQG